jgi:hypothetical protein
MLLTLLPATSYTLLLTPNGKLILTKYAGQGTEGRGRGSLAASLANGCLTGASFVLERHR